jgi:hypothetical protein
MTTPIQHSDLSAKAAQPTPSGDTFAARYEAAYDLFMDTMLKQMVAHLLDDAPKSVLAQLTFPDYVARDVAPAGSPLHRRVLAEYQRREALGIPHGKTEQASPRATGAATPARRPTSIFADYIESFGNIFDSFTPAGQERMDREIEAENRAKRQREMDKLFEPSAPVKVPDIIAERARRLTQAMPPGAILYPTFIQRALGTSRHAVWAKAIMDLGWTPRRITKEHAPRQRLWQAPGGPTKRDRGPKAWKRIDPATGAAGAAKNAGAGKA